MTVGIAIVAFLFGLVLGLTIKVGRAEGERDVEDMIEELTKRNRKP